MIVIRIAITPSLKASNRPLFMRPKLEPGGRNDLQRDKVELNLPPGLRLRSRLAGLDFRIDGRRRLADHSKSLVSFDLAAPGFRQIEVVDPDVDRLRKLASINHFRTKRRDAHLVAV